MACHILCDSWSKQLPTCVSPIPAKNTYLAPPKQISTLILWRTFVVPRCPARQSLPFSATTLPVYDAPTHTTHQMNDVSVTEAKPRRNFDHETTFAISLPSFYTVILGRYRDRPSVSSYLPWNLNCLLQGIISRQSLQRSVFLPLCDDYYQHDSVFQVSRTWQRSGRYTRSSFQADLERSQTFGHRWGVFFVLPYFPSPNET